ncbi:MAG: Piwi domain-containing protein [Candidatus Aenigmatarchaeota archaeon]
MAELVLNKFRIELIENKLPTHLYFFDETNIGNNKHYFARFKPSKILEVNFIKNDNVNKWLKTLKKKDIKDEEYIYISFFSVSNASQKIDIDNFSTLSNTLKKKYLKEIFIRKLKEKFIVEPFKEGCDFCIYIENNNSSAGYKKFTRFDFVLDIYKDNYEISISVGSTDTYILNVPPEVQNKIADKQKLNYVVNNILLKNNTERIFDYPIKANAEVRNLIGITVNPKRKFYKEYYDKINEIVKSISDFLKEDLILHTNFKSITEIKQVSFEKNKMIFRNGNEDFSTVNGMRDYGPYYIPENIKEIQLLFIYPDSESANRLYSYFSRGYRHFPGLESYVGIPANIYGNKINYNNNINLIETEIKKQLPNSTYDNIIAVCIMPFSKSTANRDQSEVYFNVKKTLLGKNIPSQFIHRNKIFEENFHFSLPNIAIAMLAKCGGVPWKLSRPHYNQLTVGFNVFSVKQDNGNLTFLGSAVFFDNEGIIKSLRSIQGNSIKNISEILVNAINEYKNSSKETNKKIVIHFYKSISNVEANFLENEIKDRLGPDASFAVVEINDSKITTDLCFDLEYPPLMPQSGTYVKLKSYEYLLFNNLRYWDKPINPINQEELPIKLRIYDPYNNFDHNELISQVYEFSRMYWKSLKQKAQPVTTIYSKLIAEYTYEFGGTIPDNEVARKRVWFI